MASRSRSIFRSRVKNFFRYWLPWICASILLVYLASRGEKELPKWKFFGSDKIFHFIYYFGLGLLSARLSYFWLGKKKQVRHLAQLAAVTAAVTFGLIDEFIQSFTPGRNVEIWDLVADLCGGLAAAAIFPLYREWVSPLEAKLAQLWKTR